MSQKLASKKCTPIITNTWYDIDFIFLQPRQVRHEALHHVELRTVRPRVPGLGWSVITLCLTRARHEPHRLPPGVLDVACGLLHPVVRHGLPLLPGHGPLVSQDDKERAEWVCDPRAETGPWLWADLKWHSLRRNLMFLVKYLSALCR